eukprot:m.1537569 g.1537569  ORF g.1537569 m.1537569 type:complete len:137 (+) comp25245_c0_seq32:4685-5095(+)
MDGERPTLVCQSATVVPTHRHFKTICDFADQFRTRVPVLIICGQRQQALSLHQHILSDKRFSDSTGSCQLFAEFEGGKRRDTKHWNDIVANAVTQVPSEIASGMISVLHCACKCFTKHSNTCTLLVWVRSRSWGHC